jgi:hypothetical protein
MPINYMGYVVDYADVRWHCRPTWGVTAMPAW